MQGVEYEQQVIGAYCGVLGEQGEESEDAPGYSGTEEQDQVESPEGFSAADAVDGSGCHQCKQQQGRLHRGDSAGAVVGISQSGYHYFLFGGHQRTGLAFLVYDPGCTEEVLHVEGDEHHQSSADGAVGFAAHAQVHAEA